MRTNIHGAVMAAMVIGAPSVGFGQQFTNPGNAGWWHTVNAGTTPELTRGVSIGNAGAGPYPSVFNIRGELLPAANQTPEVFRTTAPTTGNTFWRMFQGGTGAGNERGQLFAVPGQNHFNINAPNGDLRLFTSSVERARMNSTVSYTIGSFAAQAKNGALGLSPSNTLWSNGPGPFSRLHLHDGTTNVLQASYRPWMRTGITLTGNRDHQYIGQKGKQSDYTDLVIHWSDNPGEYLKDRLRFIFTSGYDAGVA